MPGYIIHLAMAEEVLKGLNHTSDKFGYMYRIGSIVPDTEKTGYKQRSHFWTDDMLSHFVRKPSLDMFLTQYGNRMDEPYVLGYYSHLLMDYNFVSYYWKEHYTFYDDNGIICDDYDKVKWVHNLDTDEQVARDTFFSDKYYYGDYDRMNSYLIGVYGIPEIDIDTDLIDYGGIAEVQNEKCKNRLRDMLVFLNETRSVIRHEEIASVPLLRAFNMKELKKLISNTANIILQRM